MKWKILLASTALAAFAWHSNAAFFQAAVNGPSQIPAGVSLLAIDGGSTYYGGLGYTNASASFTFNNSSCCSVPQVVYTNGWDDPKFFAVGPWLSAYANQNPQANQWVMMRYTTAFAYSAPYLGQLDLFKTNGVSVISPWFYMGQNTSVDRAPGTEVAGIALYDEPFTYETGVIQQIPGIPTTSFSATVTNNLMNVTSTPTNGAGIIGQQFGATQFTGSVQFLSGTGVTPSTFYPLNFGTGLGLTGNYSIAGGTLTGINTTITLSAVNGMDDSTALHRFAWANYTNGWMFGYQTDKNNTHVSAATIMSTKFATPSGNPAGGRHLDMTGIDLYFMVEGYKDPAYDGSNNQKTISNVYDTSNGSRAMTIAEAVRGSHYGDMLDIQRSFQTTYSLPLHSFVETGNCQCNMPYDIQPVEINWAIWSSIIHGARGIALFDTDGFEAPSQCSGQNSYCSFMQTAQSVTVTGSITSNVLTVTVGPGYGHQLGVGMVSTAGVTGATILQQTSLPANATFTGVFSGGGTTLTTSSTSGTIQVPSILTGSGVSATSAGATNIVLTAFVSGVNGGNGVYTVQANSASPSGTITAWALPGQAGTYAVSGPNVASSSLTFQQSMLINGTPTAVGMTQGVTATNTLVASLAPVINSQFAKAFVTPSPNGYQFEGLAGAGGMTQSCGNLQTFTCGLATGIETTAKYYNGATYTASTGDTIDKGFYIFADTRMSETSSNISATFTLCGACSYSTATVIGESRSIPISAGAFTDTFANAWTVHIYKIR